MVNHPTLTPVEFRELFPATNRWAWLDTPGCPPAAAPVSAAMLTALSDWQSGEFEWLEWDMAAQRARSLFARLIGADENTVALLPSVSEAAATVADALPPGKIVMLDQEYRSVLHPFLAQRAVDVELVPASGDPVKALLEAITPDTVLVAVSELLSSDGVRHDLAVLREATDQVGARLFVDATQACGALDSDYSALRLDYLAVHGYKWLLCPRGAAWLVTRADRLPDLVPIAPGWKSSELPHGYFGGPPPLARNAMRLDGSPAWFSWIGACAALELHLTLDHQAVARHVTGLTDRIADSIAGQVYRTGTHRTGSHILVIEYDPVPDLPDRLRQAGVKVTATDRRLRVGIHYFNNDADVDNLLDVLAHV